MFDSKKWVEHHMKGETYRSLANKMNKAGIEIHYSSLAHVVAGKFEFSRRMEREIKAKWHKRRNK